MVPIVFLWTLIRDCLDPEHEGHKIQTALRDSTGPEVAEPSAPPPEPLYAVPEGTACKAGGSDDVLSSDEQEELNEQAAQYHREDVLWEMMVSMQSPSGKGELKHSGLSEEQLENLIQKIVIAVKKDAQRGSHSSQPVPPACPPSVLAGLDPPQPFVELQELISIPASLPGENIKIRSEILLSPLQQAIKRVNEEGEHIPGFSGIYPVFGNAQQQRYYEPLPFKQLKPDEPYQDFVAHLLEAIGKVIGDEQAGMVLAKQLAYENANSACQAALRPYRKKRGLSDYVWICADIGPSYVQDITLATTLQGKTVKEVLYQQQK